MEAEDLRNEIALLREKLADAYVVASGKAIHSSDCATSCAPAETPGPCDCDLFEIATSTPPPRLKRKPTPKQATILNHLESVKPLPISLNSAIYLVGRDIYANAEKHVGALLARMVKQGMIVRIKPGMFRLP